MGGQGAIWGNEPILATEGQNPVRSLTRWLWRHSSLTCGAPPPSPVFTLARGFHEHAKDALPRKTLVGASLEVRQHP